MALPKDVSIISPSTFENSNSFATERRPMLPPGCKAVWGVEGRKWDTERAPSKNAERLAVFGLSSTRRGSLLEADSHGLCSWRSAFLFQSRLKVFVTRFLPCTLFEVWLTVWLVRATILVWIHMAGSGPKGSMSGSYKQSPAHYFECFKQPVPFWRVSKPAFVHRMNNLSSSTNHSFLYLSLSSSNSMLWVKQRETYSWLVILYFWTRYICSSRVFRCCNYLGPY